MQPFNHTDIKTLTEGDALTKQSNMDIKEFVRMELAEKPNYELTNMINEFFHREEWIEIFEILIEELEGEGVECDHRLKRIMIDRLSDQIKPSEMIESGWIGEPELDEAA